MRQRDLFGATFADESDSLRHMEIHGVSKGQSGVSFARHDPLDGTISRHTCGLTPESDRTAALLFLPGSILGVSHLRVGTSLLNTRATTDTGVKGVNWLC